MNILFGKFGRTVMFDKSKWSTIGGDNEAPTLLLKLAQLHPEDTFYLVSSSDFNKHEKLVNQYRNIVPLMDGFNMKYDDDTYIWNKCKARKITFDYGIIYNGITAANNINGKSYLNNHGEIAKTKTLIFASRYCAPIVTVLNESKVRWCLLTPDPRFYPMQAKDIQNPPEVVWSQYNEKNIFKSRDYMTRNDTYNEIDSVYGEIETCFLIGKQKAKIEQFIKPRTDLLNIVLNEGGGSSGGLSRGPILKEWVLDNFKDDELSNNIQIYGKWSDDWMADTRFKGCVRIEELSKLLINTKYTFIIPIQKDWVTAKFCEMSYFGIIPFMHPYYDTQKNIHCPDFCRVSSPQELKEKIQFLEDFEDERISLLKEIHLMYGIEYNDGSKVISMIYNQINKPIYKPNMLGVFNKQKERIS